MSNRRILLGCLAWMVVGVVGCTTAVSSPTPTSTATPAPPTERPLGWRFGDLQAGCGSARRPATAANRRPRWSRSQNYAHDTDPPPLGDGLNGPAYFHNPIAQGTAFELLSRYGLLP